MKLVLKVLLLAAVILMAYLCYESVMTPIRFDETRENRTKEITTRLIEIRKVQIEYKNRNGVHAATFEDLEKFLNDGKLPFVVKEGTLTDEQLEKGMTEQEAVKKGLIKRDTFWVVAKDTLLGTGYNVSDMRYVPGTQKKVVFNMDTATLTSGSGYVVKVFECGVKFDDFLGDLNSQLLTNIKLEAAAYEKYPGLRVGSLEEINNNAGNWE